MNHRITSFCMIAVLVLTGFLLGGCFSDWSNSIEGKYKGEKYSLQSRQTKSRSSDNTDWRLQLGSLPAIDINPATISWGPPYSQDIFAGNDCVYITDKGRQYNNMAYSQGANYVFYSVLFISPQQVTKSQFDAWCQFMKDEWSVIDSRADASPRANLPHIIALVYGTRQSFEQEFDGIQRGKKMKVRLETDGRVKLISDDTTATEYYSGLSLKVQMPGKKLFIDTVKINGGLTIAQLASFRNNKNQTLDSFFIIFPGKDQADNQMEIESKLCFKWHATHMEAKGKRQPLDDENGSYLWFKGDGTFEDFTYNAVKSGAWKFDSKAQLLKTTEDSTTTENTIQSITDKELILTTKTAGTDGTTLIFTRVN